jgi:glutamate synthase (NADPH/NADH) large chain
LRKRAEHTLPIYFPSLSAKTIVYKGMLTTGQLEEFFPDLSDERVISPLALVHSRFSTNTFFYAHIIVFKFIQICIGWQTKSF